MFIFRAGLFLVAFAGSAAAVHSQGSSAAAGDVRLPVGATLVDLAVRVFDKSDGLQSPTVYSVSEDLSKRLWIGTDYGPMRFDGDKWQLQPLPAATSQLQTRAILQSTDSSFWFATRSGVVRMRGNTQTVFNATHGLPSAITYSIMETRALTGEPQVLVGTSAGVGVFDGIRFHTLALPPGLMPEGLMLGETRAPDGALELWLASSRGKVARFAKNKWMVFGSAQGLVGRSAEAVFATRNNPSTRLLVPGEAGVFAFHDDGPRGPRFEHIAGSPRRSFRVAELVRTDGTRELWVGNLAGELFRRTNAGWDLVDVASQQQGGRVTALNVVTGHAGGTAVYVGTYGGRLARISVSSAATLQYGRETRRDVMMTVLAERMPSGRTSLWMGTLNTGLHHLDERGHVTEYSRETHQQFSLIRALAMLSSVDHLASEGDTIADTKDLWISTDNGPFRREAGQLVQHAAGIEGRSVRAFARGDVPGGTNSLLAATDSGVYRWANERWEKVRAIGNEDIRTMVNVNTRAGPMLVMAVLKRTINLTPRGVTYDSAVPVPDQSEPGQSVPVTSSHAITFTSLCALNDSRVAGRLFAGTANRGVWWRAAGTRWEPIPPSLSALAGKEYIRQLSCLDDGRLLIGTAIGLVVLDVRDTRPSRWTMQAVASQEDGLPATEIQAMAPDPSNGLVWISTTRGVGALQMNRIEMPPVPRLTVELLSDAQTQPVPDSGELRAGNLDLSIRPILVTNHREFDTRYRVRLDRAGEKTEITDSSSAQNGDSLAWTVDPQAHYRGLSAGDYTLHVWARDYAGRIAGPSVLHFRVVPQLWRRWWAILLYVLTATALIYAAHRWRLRTLRRTNARLANSERMMRASEEKFRALFDQAAEAHLLVDGTRVMAINAAAKALLGYNEDATPASEFYGDPLEFSSLFPAAIVQSLPVLATTGVVQEFMCPQAAADEIPASIRITQIPLDDRTLMHVVVTDLRAVREAEVARRRLEDQVRDAQKLESLGTLAGGVAHDFNNLLGVIRGNVELARDTLHDADAVAEYLNTVYDASDRARDLVRQILTFSRRSSTREEFVDLARLTRELSPMLRSMIPSSVEIMVTGVDLPLLVKGDPTQLQQILLNLATNADHAMRSTAGGRLTIALDSVLAGDGVLSASGLVVRLRVSDTGIGMSPDVVARVFEPFFTTKPIGEGTGLGMAVLHGIVSSHEGRVRVTSVQGKGTVFEVVLPEAVDTSVPQRVVGAESLNDTAQHRAFISAGPVHVPTRPPSDVHIVLVDDEPAVGRVCESALKRFGYRVSLFADPAAAIACVRRAPNDVDLVVTDQTMPGLTGDVLALELHRLRTDLPVIIMSGYRYALTTERISEVGAHAVLQKPVSLATLRVAVESALTESALVAH